jgi:hypothetical protein
VLLLLLSGCKGTDSQPIATTVEVVEPQAAHLRQLALLQNNTDVIPPHLPRVELFSMYNREAPVPPQCYTRTEGKHNPCYVCHQNAVPGRENTLNDGDFQKHYAFSETGMTNHWSNLFVDRNKRIAAISDAEIQSWTTQENYSELAPRLQAARFEGWIPDIKNLQLGAAAFDADGFAKDGSLWVAFIYKPLPSTFWPTNGATDDVMIRLPATFRSTASGEYSSTIYLANLAILEANIKGFKKISTVPLDERNVGVDLDGNGELGIAEHIAMPRHFVGGAQTVEIVPFLYPQGTEFLHTVRYLGIADDGSIYNAPRIKEVRYMKRWLASDHAQLRHWYQAENNEKLSGELPAYTNMGHGGLASPMGWQLAGFIEDKNGRLRVNTFEETMYCMGCHNTIGSTIDKVFSFSRKVDGARGWGYVDLHGMADAPNLDIHAASGHESKGEIATYLERTGGGSEFRNTPEMAARWYRQDGSVNTEALASKDVYTIIAPSAQRALQLNKAYKVIVEEQSFLFGREPIVTPPHNVYRYVDEKTAPTLPENLQYVWDIRLDWQHSQDIRTD